MQLDTLSEEFHLMEIFRVLNWVMNNELSAYFVLAFIAVNILFNFPINIVDEGVYIWQSIDSQCQFRIIQNV